MTNEEYKELAREIKEDLSEINDTLKKMHADIKLLEKNKCKNKC